MKNILSVHCPNLNLFEERVQDFYGLLTLDEINAKLSARYALNNAKRTYNQINANVFARESFCWMSYFYDIAVGIIIGFGATGFKLTPQFALQHSVRS